jgi:hypothetical protein
MIRHAREHPVPLSALLDPDPDLRLVWAPMTDYPDGSCRYEACCCDEHCSCCTKRDQLHGLSCREVEGFRRENWCGVCRDA